MRVKPWRSGLGPSLVWLVSTCCAASPLAAQDSPQDAVPVAVQHTEEIETAFADAITVRAESLRQIDERSLDEERRSLPLVEVASPDQLGRFPDRDAAGAAQRLPGITVLHEQGDARLVLVRGFLPGYNSATLDGERIPAGEADERAVALDLVPTELLAQVVVTKTLTPAMEGDAIGGTVDLVTRGPPVDREREASVTLAGGHDDGSDGERRLAAGRLGGWLVARRLGVSLSASRLEADRGVQSVATTWDGDEAGEVRRQDHTVARDRSGLAASLEWRHSEGTTLRLRGLWSEFEDLERRRAAIEDADGTLSSELKDRAEWQRVESLSLSVDHISGAWKVMPRLSWNRGREADPDRLDTIFQADGGADAVTDYQLAGFRTEHDRSSNEDLVASIDLGRPLVAGRSSWQAGVRWRRKEVMRDDNLLVYEPDDEAEPVVLSEVVESAWRPVDPFFGQPGFDLGPFADPGLARGLFARLALEGRSDPEQDAGDFEGQETVAAGYAMAEWSLGGQVAVLAGARYEETESSYFASELLLDEAGEIGARVPTSGGRSYGELLPSLILKAALGENDVLRAAITRGLARPDLEQMAPARLVVPEDGEVVVGNPGLRPVTSWNLDLHWQRALRPLGSVAVGLFAKELDDVVAIVRGGTDVTSGLRLVQPQNAGDATVTGAELSFQNRFGSRVAGDGGWGLSANLTWADARSRLADRPPMSLPGQARWSGSLVLSFERAGVSSRLLYSYRDQILKELGESPELDIYQQERSQLDLSLQLQASRHWSLFLEAFNLTDEGVRRFEGAPAHPVFDEQVGWWATAGIRFDG